MAFDTSEEVIAVVQTMMGAVSDKIAADGLDRAVTTALAELHWTLPINDPIKEYWIVERSKRHSISILLIESADKFQYKKIYLQHRFDHYFKLLQLMDEQFAEALENNEELFDLGTWSDLSYYITNGFDYNMFGVDDSYDTWT